MTIPPPLPPQQKSVLTAYLLNILPAFLFLAGIHRFYAGKPISGTIWLLTLGFYGIGQLIDLLLIPSMIRDANQRNMAGYEMLMTAYKQPSCAVGTPIVANENTNNNSQNIVLNVQFNTPGQGTVTSPNQGDISVSEDVTVTET